MSIQRSGTYRAGGDYDSTNAQLGLSYSAAYTMSGINSIYQIAGAFQRYILTTAAPGQILYLPTIGTAGLPLIRPGATILINLRSGPNLTVQDSTFNVLATLSAGDSVELVAVAAPADWSVISSGGGGGGGSETLQDVYDNSVLGGSSDVVVTTNRPLILRNSPGDPDTDLIRLQNNAASSTYFLVSTGPTPLDCIVTMGAPTTFPSTENSVAIGSGSSQILLLDADDGAAQNALAIGSAAQAANNCVVFSDGAQSTVSPRINLATFGYNAGFLQLGDLANGPRNYGTALGALTPANRLTTQSRLTTTGPASAAVLLHSTNAPIGSRTTVGFSIQVTAACYTAGGIVSLYDSYTAFIRGMGRFNAAGVYTPYAPTIDTHHDPSLATTAVTVIGSSGNVTLSIVPPAGATDAVIMWIVTSEIQQINIA